MAAPLSTAERLEYLVDYIREFMRDHAELNRLVAGEEHGDRLISMAIFDAVDQISSMPPPVPVSIENIPVHLIRKGSVTFLLESLGLLMTRNQLNYRTGRGTGIGLQDKTPMLMNWISQFKAQFVSETKDWKIAENLREALQGSSLYSEYSVINGLYGNWGV